MYINPENNNLIHMVCLSILKPHAYLTEVIKNYPNIKLPHDNAHNQSQVFITVEYQWTSQMKNLL